MLLALDVGNTNIVIGFLDASGIRNIARLETDRDKTAHEYAISLRQVIEFSGIAPEDVDGAILSSVVPPINGALVAAVRMITGIRPLVVGPGMKTGLNIRYENPRELGSDRIANAVAVSALYGGPAIFIDFGTATTYGVISAKSEFLGGAIGPGLRMMNRALSTGTAKLPSIELVLPPQVIGKTTVSNIQAGILYGYIGSVEKIIKHMKHELGGSDIRVIATGGMAHLVKSNSDVIDEINPDLTLTGLRLIYEKNM